MEKAEKIALPPGVTKEEAIDILLSAQLLAEVLYTVYSGQTLLSEDPNSVAKVAIFTQAANLKEDLSRWLKFLKKGK